MRNATITVMIHNGQATVDSTLKSILAQDAPGLMKVLAICNGSTDNSASICRDYQKRMTTCGIDYQVCVLQENGRARSLNSIRDQIEGHLICVDQDAVLSENCIRELVGKLDEGFEFAAPELWIELPHSWVVRNYYAFWRNIPYVGNSPSTIGTYAISSGIWPSQLPLPLLHSDDKFMRLATSPEKRIVVAGTKYSVIAPSNSMELIKARRRYMLGNRELVRLASCRKDNDVPRHQGLVRRAMQPDKILSAAVFLLVCAAACVNLPKRIMKLNAPRQSRPG